MSSLSPVGRSAATRKNDRVSLCRFTFADGRRCRLPRATTGTPRIADHPNFCHYHAQKESRAATAEKLGQDLAYFFSADYVSANDLTTALARLIPAAIRGDIKPRTVRAHQATTRHQSAPTSRTATRTQPTLAQSTVYAKTSNSFRINTYKPRRNC